MIRPYTHKEGRLRIVCEHLLLVEGKDELNLFGKLIEGCFTEGEEEIVVQIEEVGKEQFRQRFHAIIKAARVNVSLQAIGIVRDADDSAKGAFDSVCDSVHSFGFVPPTLHGNFSKVDPSIGVFIVPDGTRGGAIEAICREAVQGDAVGGCVEEYLRCLGERDALLSRNQDKSFTHAYLAAMRDPVARVGEGAIQGVWNFESPAFVNLRQFIKELVS